MTAMMRLLCSAIFFALFSSLANTNPVFDLVLGKFFHGAKDPKTLTIMLSIDI